MKNYVKVVLQSKHIDIFPFEDTDEGAVMEAAKLAENLRKFHGGRVVAWSLTGFAAREKVLDVETFETLLGVTMHTLTDISLSYTELLQELQDMLDRMLDEGSWG